MNRAGLVALAAAGLACQAGGAAAAPPAVYVQRYADTCAACHGPAGVSVQPDAPSLAGQPSFYAITQLFLFRDGRRDNALMTAVAKGMTDADLRGFSEVIGALPPQPTPQDNPPDPERRARGAALAERLHCAGCHGGDYAGGKQVPRLAGQREDYLLRALQGFRAGRRVGYTPAMTEALAGTTPDALQDLAHHLAHLPGQTPAGKP